MSDMFNCLRYSPGKRTTEYSGIGQKSYTENKTVAVSLEQ
jgi:hypothetical protein